MHGYCDVLGHSQRSEEFARLECKTDVAPPYVFDEAVLSATPGLFEVDIGTAAAVCCP